LNTYGYNYTNSFSADSSFYYYNYSTLGIGFGFDRKNNVDWNCDGIQIAKSGMLQKSIAGSQLSSNFPNLGFSDIERNIVPNNYGNRLPIKIEKQFR
jgi:hypothetical protein